jgi:hypothetical protein
MGANSRSRGSGGGGSTKLYRTDHVGARFHLKCAQSPEPFLDLAGKIGKWRHAVNRYRSASRILPERVQQR